MARRESLRFHNFSISYGSRNIHTNIFTGHVNLDTSKVKFDFNFDYQSKIYRHTDKGSSEIHIIGIFLVKFKSGLHLNL